MSARAGRRKINWPARDNLSAVSRIPGNNARGHPHSRPTAVTAFVDWQTQMHHTRVRTSLGDRAELTLQRTTRIINRVLKMESPGTRFSVDLRFYHGWHKGWEPTDNLRAIAGVRSAEVFADNASPDIVFSQGVRYGHTLLSALPERSHQRTAIHLPNTLRDQEGSSPTEKMVDTALAADLLAWAHSDPEEWALVLSDDDDIVPPVLTAESWMRPRGGRVLIVSAQRRRRDFLKLDGLLQEL